MQLGTGGTAIRKGKRRAALAVVAALACTMYVPSTAAATATDDYPSRPVRLVGGTPAGTGVDFMLRAMQTSLQADLGQPIVIEQRPGADQLLAARYVATAPADGYTLLVATGTQVAVNPAVYASPGYDPDRDFTPVTLLARYNMVVVVHPSLPVHTLAELAAWSRAHPGTLNYGTGGSSTMLVAEGLKAAIGADLTHIPYSGIPASINALLAGDVHVGILEVSLALPSIRAGRMRALVVSSERRLVQLPDVPTFAEAGHADVVIPIWNALYAPAGTPAAIIARLRTAFVRALDDPEIAERIMAAGIVPVTSTPEGLRAKAHRERAEVAALLQRLGVAPR